jgi:hypothetical protein
MPRITVPAVTIRTTSDGEGYPQGIATGMGQSPELALLALKQQAQTQAKTTAARRTRPGFHRSSASASPPLSTSEIPPGGRPAGARQVDPSLHDESLEWRFEVVDVHLAPLLMEGGERGWLAYGTLLSEGEQPGAAGYWPKN